jgi:LDH2 family malate/lactate/ureidoglycolate dehydrogenase
MLALGFKEVLFPGEPEHRLSETRKAEGIPYTDAEREMFVNMA